MINKFRICYNCVYWCQVVNEYGMCTKRSIITSQGPCRMSQLEAMGYTEEDKLPTKATESCKLCETI